MGIKPTLSHLRCDALPIELPSSWEQGGGEEGIQVLVLGVLNSKLTSPLKHPWANTLGDDAATSGTPLDELTIMPNHQLIITS